MERQKIPQRPLIPLSELESKNYWKWHNTGESQKEKRKNEYPDSAINKNKQNNALQRERRRNNDRYSAISEPEINAVSQIERRRTQYHDTDSNE